MSFVHLHLHSQYSLLEASCRASDVTKKASELGMPALALTDNGNMFGAIEFYYAARGAGIKPIIGLDVFLAPKGRLVKGEDREAARQPNRRLVLLAQDYEGYQNLCQISSIGYQEGFYYKPRVDYEVLEKFSDKLIALSGGIRGDVPFTFTEHGEQAALEKVEKLHEIFPERFYLEMNRTGVSEWEEINRFLIEASKQKGVPLVATNDVHYTKREDQLAQEVLICIGTNKTLQDDTRFRLGSDQFYLKSPEEMEALFQDVPEAVENTVKIADRCNIEFQLKDEEGKTIYHLPTYPVADGRSLKDEIKRLSHEGLLERFKEAEQRGEAIAEEDRPPYFERLDYELSVIDGMGFNGYFLIVQDFINWSKENEIPVGPGRGSGAGSLVAYVLRITDLDPVQHNLIFERFLNPERVSMPDFDIDFCQDRRPEVINYVTEKYGQESVSQIITYGKLQARAAIRDVGRVLGMTYADVDVVSKLMPDKLGITLKEAIEMESRIQDLMESDPQVATLMDLAQSIEGLVRHAGIHAAGVIIADGRLVSHAPLYRGVDGENVVQYDMKHAEKIGLIKFDFLGLKTLTHIKYALDLIEKNQGKKISTSEISMSDKGIYELMADGDTAGVFQFEGDGITDTTKNIKPTCFSDITAINALYRPGPMDMIPEYTARKHGKKKVEYLFPELEEILSETYGIIIYQEQVQLIAAKIANYSLGEADMLRRAMGKKIAEEMARQRERFINGAQEAGHDGKKANELFDLMQEFAKYGFNKSHAAAYCVVAGQTAWLKRYYPVEFFAALLSTEMSDTDKVVKYVKDAQAHGIEVCPPDVNYSAHKFTVAGRQIFFGLGAVKGVGQSAVEALIEAREKEGGFKDLDHFFKSIDLRRVNKKVIECLIKAGAFEGFCKNRAQLMAGYTKYLDMAEVERKDRELGQASLFSMVAEEETKIRLDEVDEWSRTTKLAYEKEVLGFYLSDHPMSGLDAVVKVWTTCPIAELKDQEPKKRVILAGLVAGLRDIITKKGTRMAFSNLEDLSGSVELVTFPNVYEKYEMALKTELPVIIAGTLEIKNETCKILVDSVTPLNEALEKTKGISFRFKSDSEDKLDELKTLVEKFPGKAPVYFEFNLPEMKRKVQLKMKAPEGIHPTKEFFEGVQSIFGQTELVKLH